MTVKKLSRLAQMTKDLLYYKAHDILTLSKAFKDVSKCNSDKYMASGVIITIRDLSGKEVVESFMISDGLSEDSIAALKADIKRTYDLRVSLNKL